MKNKKKANIIDFPTPPSKIERQVEAILFAASEPLDVETIERRIQTSVNLKILEDLKSIYKKEGLIWLIVKTNGLLERPMIVKTNGTAKIYSKKLSKATIETLAIIVYHQLQEQK